MQRILTVLLAIVTASSLHGLEVSSHDALVGRVAVVDCALAVSAGFLANPQYFMPDCTLSDEALPRTLMVSRSDLSGYLPMVPAKRSNQTWFQQLETQAKGPLDDMIREILIVHAWKKGDLLVSGTYQASWPQGASVASLVAKALRGRFDELAVSVDLHLEGKRITRDLFVTGVARITAEGPSTDGLEFRYESK